MHFCDLSDLSILISISVETPWWFKLLPPPGVLLPLHRQLHIRQKAVEERTRYTTIIICKPDSTNPARLASI